MKKNYFTSETEWQILKYLWNSKKASVREIWESLYPGKEKAYTTIQTYLERMVEKGILSKEKIGLVNFYSPMITKDDALSQATERFVDKAFNGSFISLANFLIRSHKLKEEDVNELRDILEKREEEP